MAMWLHELSVGDWFQVGNNSPFEIVAIDLRAETVEVQYFDGTVAEIDFDSWIELAATASVSVRWTLSWSTIFWLNQA